jgi:hypothetical protein
MSAPLPSFRHEPSRTKCYCGSSPSFEFCSDCRDWLLANSLRISAAWRFWLETPIRWWGDGADAAEADDRAFYESVRHGA